MRIFNEVGRWYSIPCKILTQVIYVKKMFKSTEKSYHPDTDPRTDGRTDRQSDRQTDEQGESSIPPLNFDAGGYNESLAMDLCTWDIRLLQRQG